MKKITRILSVLLAICLMAALALPAMAATSETSVIDYTKTGSVTIYKYDYTSASEDGVWDGSYVSSGVYDQNVNDKLGTADKVNNLGAAENGTSNSYALKGVEFTYLKVGEFATYSAVEDGVSKIMLLYGIEMDNPLLEILGLTSDDRYANADYLANDYSAGAAVSNGNWYFTSDTLIDALKNALTTAPTATKSALENYITECGGTAMPLTDENGMTSAEGMELGLYLFVETKVPEMVIDTTNPWLVTLPMTSINGTNATNGGQEWLYDITLYPKNQTGDPTLEKTVREDKADTGANDDSDVITDGFKHTATASAGDILDYQIISTLPSITSEATYLTAYTFTDTLSSGINYVQNDVVLTWYKDAACTDEITSWDMDSGMFTVSVAEYDMYNIMTINMTEEGMTVINSSNEVWGNDATKSGYSDCTVRISYSAVVNSDESLILGDSGNPNEVVLSWIRTSSSYHDTLIDDCHVYAFGLDLTKVFSDNNGDYSKVNFTLKNSSDSYWVKAEQDAETGIYYVVDHVATEAEGTVFVPTAEGKIIVKGLEDDTYVLSETQTDNGYSKLERGIEITISTEETSSSCDIYSGDTLGVVQTLDHKLLTASATRDGDDAPMIADNGSVNALVNMEVENPRQSLLPETGDIGAYTLAALGTLMFVGCCGLIVVVAKLKRETNTSAQ